MYHLSNMVKKNKKKNHNFFLKNYKKIIRKIVDDHTGGLLQVKTVIYECKGRWSSTTLLCIFAFVYTGVPVYTCR